MREVLAVLDSLQRIGGLLWSLVDREIIDGLMSSSQLIDEPELALAMQILKYSV